MISKKILMNYLKIMSLILLKVPSTHCHSGCESHSELNIPQPLLSRAVKWNCLGLSSPDPSAGKSGWCFELSRMWGFHQYHFCLLHSAPWPLELHPGLWMSAVATADLPQSAGSDVGGEDQLCIKIWVESKLAAPRVGWRAAISTAGSQDLN